MTPGASPKARIELVIDRDFKSYSQQDQDRLLAAVKELLSVEGDIRVTSRKPGSVRITLELTPQQAEQLYRAVRSGALAEHHVVGVNYLNIVESPGNNSTTRDMGGITTSAEAAATSIPSSDLFTQAKAGPAIGWHGTSTGTTTDIQPLLERLYRADDSARRELLERAYGRLVRIASASFHMHSGGLHGRHDFESVVDEAWIRLMRALESTRPETVDGFFRLMVVQVRQALLQIVRRQRRRDAARFEVPHDTDELEALLAFDDGDSSNKPERLAIPSELHEQVDRLPEPEKMVFGLHYYLGLSQAQAAEILGLPPKQVTRLWHQATNRLTKWLEDADGLR
jgi:RNA polymerase sigma factor (sigma-70 family)